ncbi:6-phosphogluconolactonase [Pseudooceanicola sp. CBS1P-1]|uniref:6-phosphogluconolactonase n=1 Tax=Pseudooceanicola albus TaxID=2692189 RepID=A0A6L7G284_9RHOB|nr:MULTISPECIES: 6-phosphogluconolactonase [Pseudooceanicola]MBT9383696.1 6-phosphogluconolactonase [Pseudooceanicola endophyticus]MXN17550.1 6-phosphogluconolactonase [Pseudooceanicola albus]
MKFQEYPDRDLLALNLADTLASELGAALRHEDRVTFCVPGGTTPGPIFDALTAVQLDWDRVDVVLNDERWVPESSPRSNTALLRQRLLTGHAAAATLLPLRQDVETPEEGLAPLSDALKPHMPIDVLLLGMGADMHTASLFPGADRLGEALSDEAPVLLPMRADGAGEPRITITAPWLKGALSTHIVIMGAEKRAALEAARKLAPEEAPVSVLLSQATVHWAE